MCGLDMWAGVPDCHYFWICHLDQKNTDINIIAVNIRKMGQQRDNFFFLAANLLKNTKCDSHILNNFYIKGILQDLALSFVLVENL